MRGVVVLCCALAGCNQIYGLDSTKPRDALIVDAAIDGPGCSDFMFEPAIPLPGFTTNDAVYEPQLRHDHLEVWFIKPDNNIDLYRARRLDKSMPFGPEELMYAGTIEDTSPSLTGDGKRLFFVSNRNGSREVYETMRPTLDSPFGQTPSKVFGLPIGVNSFDISYDGATIYYSVGNNIFQATRTGVEFGPGVMVAKDTEYVSISPDGRELFYQVPASKRIERRVRASSGDVFPATGSLLYDNGDDPDMAADGETLIFASGDTLLVRTRMCKPP